MTIREELQAFLPKAKCINDYIVEELNDSFLPRRTYRFETAEEATAFYDELVQTGKKPGFLRKYAVVAF